ncbi:hypothetical protein Ahy_B08g089459 isoform B [Arachis hypogaea]|uniref:Uncharacterized protein n=1 Tax=Arachis hypogaea TaxID=3818 RepID=A0A444XXY5_ARAHY|nr:hypothetical protein Ahy_B08g089459 isoform B [Arachis hypogaea]
MRGETPVPQRETQLQAAHPAPPSPSQSRRRSAEQAPPSHSQSKEPARPNPLRVSQNERLLVAPDSDEAAQTIPSEECQTGKPNPSDTKYGASISDFGTFYFDGETIGGHEHKDSLSMTSSVVPWVTAFAATVCGEINVDAEGSSPIHHRMFNL